MMLSKLETPTTAHFVRQDLNKVISAVINQPQHERKPYRFSGIIRNILTKCQLQFLPFENSNNII